MNFTILIHVTTQNRNKYLSRQVQHGKNVANDGWTPRNFIENEDTTFNEGFTKRKSILKNLIIVNCEIPLNRYSFFKVLKDKMLPNSKFELNIVLESDNNLI